MDVRAFQSLLPCCLANLTSWSQPYSRLGSLITPGKFTLVRKKAGWGVGMNLMHQPNPTAFGWTLLSAMGTEGAAGRGSMLLLYKNRWLKGDVIHT